MTVGTGGLRKGMDSARGSVKSFASSVRSAGSGIASAGKGIINTFAKIGLAVEGVTALAKGLAGAVSGPLKLAAEAEQTAVSFRVLLGSAAQANKTLDELRQFAASTPFQFPDIADAAKKLLAFGVTADELQPTLRSLGDISAATGQPFAELADIYGKAKVQGRLFMEDINQLQGRGINVTAQFAKQLGVAESEVRELVSSGQVNFGHLQEALRAMTAEGGDFSGMMEAQSKTLGGVWSTLKDNVSLALTEVGTAISETFDLKGVTTSITSFVQSMMPKLKEFLAGFRKVWEDWKPIIVQGINVLVARWRALSEMVGEVIGSIKSVLSGIGLPSFEEFKSVVLDVLIAMEFGWTRWRTVLELALKGALLGIVAFAGEVHHHFTVRIPAILKWMAENWREILHDVFEFTRTVFTNLAKNVVKIIKNIPKLIKGQVSFGELWTPLLDGAEFELKKLPDIPPRVMSDFEQNLRKDVSSIAGGFAQDFQKFVSFR